MEFHIVEALGQHGPEAIIGVVSALGWRVWQDIKRRRRG